MIVPQETIIMTDTLRKNLDPFDQYELMDLFRVLQMTKLLDIFVQRVHEVDRLTILSFLSKNSLQSQDIKEAEAEASILNLLQIGITSAPPNLSVGESQLIHFSRALLRKPKVLLLDEVTSSMDSKTEQVIQGLIETQLNFSTIVSITHRKEAHREAYWDKVLVVENHKIHQLQSQ